LAAKIVKNYILPMFQNQPKKEAKNKINKNKFEFSDKNETKTVFGELKLSEKLAE